MLAPTSAYIFPFATFASEISTVPAFISKSVKPLPVTDTISCPLFVISTLPVWFPVNAIVSPFSAVTLTALLPPLMLNPVAVFCISVAPAVSIVVPFIVNVPAGYTILYPKVIVPAISTFAFFSLTV